MGSNGLRDFLDQIVAEFLPVVAKHAGGAVTADPATGVMHGNYWSRSIGEAIAICFADLEQAKKSRDRRHPPGRCWPDTTSVRC